jgi:dTDP-4-amino-4,6-dideoxygalactose transaminase
MMAEALEGIPAATLDRPAILGGVPLRTRSFAVKRHSAGDLDRLAEVLEQPDWGGIPFPNTMHERFREAFARQLGVGAALVANGTVAISIALRALEIPAGGEVIVPALTWIATAAAAVHVNLVPVLVDVSADHFCLDADAVEAAITPSTRAIIVVHLANQVADMDRIVEIARRLDLRVVEDCAHAHFATWKGQPVGTIGDAGTFSFESSKIMTSGEGGCVASRHPQVLARAMSLAHVGWKLPPYDGYEGRVFGFNARISEFQAAMLIGQLEAYPEAARNRKRNLERLVSRLEATGGFEFVAPDPRVTCGQIYEVLFRYRPGAFGGLPRDLFCKAVLAEGVEIEGTFYEPLHRSALFRPRSSEWPALRARYGDGFDGGEGHFPVAERAAALELVWIHHPLFSGEPEDVDDVVAAVTRVQRHAEAIRDAL